MCNGQPVLLASPGMKSATFIEPALNEDEIVNELAIRSVDRVVSEQAATSSTESVLVESGILFFHAVAK